MSCSVVTSQGSPLSILEGLDAVFNPILSAIYRDADLVRVIPVKERTGATTIKKLNGRPIKLQPDRVTKAMKETAGEQYTAKDARFLVLQVDADGDKIDPPLNTDDRILFDGQTWSLADITQDSAKVYWDLRATPIG